MTRDRRLDHAHRLICPGKWVARQFLEWRPDPGHRRPSNGAPSLVLLFNRNQQLNRGSSIWACPLAFSVFLVGFPLDPTKRRPFPPTPLNSEAQGRSVRRSKSCWSSGASMWRKRPRCPTPGASVFLLGHLFLGVGFKGKQMPQSGGGGACPCCIF